VTRQGELSWQFGADCTDVSAPKCASGEWVGKHGHHLLDKGNIVFFNNAGATTSGAPSVAVEYGLTETKNSLTASMVWSYAPPARGSIWLGVVQRLPNGNTLVVFSSDGIAHEVSPSGDLVRTIDAGCLGYANFRETLYGPPLR
jgi:hypothetical protein